MENRMDKGSIYETPLLGLLQKAVLREEMVETLASSVFAIESVRKIVAEDQSVMSVDDVEEVLSKTKKMFEEDFNAKNESLLESINALKKDMTVDLKDCEITMIGYM